jgi:RNA polymerase sigma-70 factor (ECF subfamily)
VTGIITRILGDRNQAEELANEVFWRFYRNRRERLGGNPTGWLYRTATRAGIDAIRAVARRSRYEQQAATAMMPGEAREAGPLDDLLRTEERTRVQAILSGMKPAQAQLILMRADGASYQELAAALGVRASGIGTLLNRAEAAFRKRYLELSTEKEEL